MLSSTSTFLTPRLTLLILLQGKETQGDAKPELLCTTSLRPDRDICKSKAEWRDPALNLAPAPWLTHLPQLATHEVVEVCGKILYQVSHWYQVQYSGHP